MKIYKQACYLILIMTLSGYHSVVSAACKRMQPWVDAGCDSCGVSPRLGSVNITNNYLQPVGSPLATSVFDFSTGVKYGDPNQVLYQCDIGDIGQIYEQIATNGDDRVGGFFDLGQRDGNPNYYATYFPYVGIKLTHIRSGAIFTRNWKSIPLTSYEIVDKKINIRVKDFSPIKADLIKLSSLPPTTGAASNYCGGMASTNMTATYTCIQPNGYVLFVGPGIPGETEGSDSAYNWGTWGTGRWNAIGMGTAPKSTISYRSTCVARNITPVVIFPTITANSLSAGGVVQNNFTVTIECDNSAISDLSSGGTVLGLQTSYSAYVAAQKLGLVNSEGGVSYLLSDDYDTNNSTAKGVGISLSNTGTGASMNFVGWANCTTAGCPLGTSAGWYPVLNGAQVNNNMMAGYTTYTTQFTATLTKIPGQAVTPGKVKATAYVLVRVQ